MDKLITAKSILLRKKNPEQWFHVKYGMNIYRGCSHGCIYCDSRSQCYGKTDFENLEVKTNALELLEEELRRIRKKGIIGIGAMSDPYLPKEREYRMTRKAMEIIYNHGFPVHLITKSNLVLEDLDLYKKIMNKSFVNITFTITTTQDDLAKKIEPGAPLPSLRLEAMKDLSMEGIYTGIALMPVLPFITDTESNIISIIEKAKECGASYIIPWFGVSLRDVQRIHFYNQLDSKFPKLKDKYIAAFGQNYVCNSHKSRVLWKLFKDKTKEYNIITNMKDICNGEKEGYEQLSLI